MWGSDTPDRVRTRLFWRDPPCTRFVLEAGLAWLALETTVRVLGGRKPRRRTSGAFAASRTSRPGSCSDSESSMTMSTCSRSSPKGKG